MEIGSRSEDGSLKGPKGLGVAEYKGGGKYGIYSEEMIFGEDGEKGLGGSGGKTGVGRGVGVGSSGKIGG
jgi:hypothetical protein